MGEFNQYQYINDYNKKNYDRVTIIMPSGKKSVIKAVADKRHQSLSEFVNELIDRELNKE